MYLQELWKKILLSLSHEIPRNQFLTWFSRTGILAFGKDGVLVIGAPREIIAQNLQAKFADRVLAYAREIEPEVKEVKIEVDLSLANPENFNAIDVTSLVSPEKTVRKIRKEKEVRITTSNGNGESHTFVSRLLNPRYALDNFIVGKDNQLAHAACIAISSKPAFVYNPLFIFGGVGLGKTHLLQATGNEMLKNFPEKIVVYLTAERFVNEIVEAIRKSKTPEFRNRYRKADCLIIDDIQFFAGRESSQTEFFHTFNELREAGKQIVVSSDRPPRELDGIDERLKSRFESGMVVEVCLSDFETRLAILQEKCQEEGVVLPPQILEFIAANVRSNIRELEGMLTIAIAELRMKNTMPTVRKIAEEFKRRWKDAELVGIDEKEIHQKPQAIRPPDVIHFVSKYYHIPPEEIIGSSRRKEILIPRQLAMYLMYQFLQPSSFDTIGDYFERRNHTTVMHAYRKIQSRLTVDKKLASDVHALQQAMGL